MKFNLKKFSSYLTQKGFLQAIEYFEETDSTNTYLKNSVNIDKKLVIVDYQTAGRGRFERKWFSQRGENLTFSVGFENFEVALIPKLNFFFPAIIAQTIEEYLSLPVEIKWPNDLLSSGKKFCGILIENSIESNGLAKLIVGIGINCNQTDFPEEISKRATSLKLILNEEVEREILLAKLIDNVAEYWNRFLSNAMGFLPIYKSKCLSIGKEISVLYKDQIFTGVFLDVSVDGELILKTKTEKLIFNSGEITTIKE